ncbi:R3H and coiled-coil domain-containing protein 1 [Brachyhypopomus gauderio]|uniref:R3H and coiled-coil domain-containing protein 1 n=1 Tax=Brachyhypopomus gauderio TaxID=698409 RepID=UPI004041FEC3
MKCRSSYEVLLVTLAFPTCDGCYLPRQENEFVHKVLEELDAFQQRDIEESVLLFPPLSSRLRFLIHKTAEEHLKLSTFSVGHDWSRRVVVCYTHLRLPSKDVTGDGDGSFYEPSREMSGRPAGRRGGSRGTRRPNKAVYVPRALRQLACESPEQPSHTSPSLSTFQEPSSDTTEPPPANHDLGPDIAEESGGEKEVFMQISGSEACSWSPTLDQTVSYFMEMTLQEQEEDDFGGSSVLPTESPSQPQSKEGTDDSYPEIIAHLKIGEVEVVDARNDYSSFMNVWINHDDFAHVIEIYDFPAMFKTEDLFDAFTDYSEGGMKITWVDNTHALGVFSSASAAMQALTMQHPLLKTRTLSKASKKAKGKALRRAEFIQPVKERPRTDTAVARRMVTRALGMRGGSRGKHC